MGSYTVTLTVTNVAGSDTETRDDYIHVFAVPTADFSVDKTQVALAQEVHFTDQSSGDPTEWSWDFGDDTTSTEQNPSHAYSSMGSYTVTLTVTNVAGSDTEIKEDYILVFEVLEKPIADITEALASHLGVSVEDIDILFCEPATMECDRFAVGAIISDTKSMAFIYDVATHQITEIEVDYTASTDDEISALSCASKYTSKWTGNRIIPCEFTVANGEYSFKYYDGYYVILDRWSFGWATVDLETATVEWGPHT